MLRGSSSSAAPPLCSQQIDGRIRPHSSFPCGISISLDQTTRRRVPFFFLRALTVRRPASLGKALISPSSCGAVFDDRRFSSPVPVRQKSRPPPLSFLLSIARIEVASFASTILPPLTTFFPLPRTPSSFLSRYNPPGRPSSSFSSPRVRDLFREILPLLFFVTLPSPRSDVPWARPPPPLLEERRGR